MSEKKTVKLSDICILEKGQQIDTSLLDDSKPYRYINGGIKESGYFDNFNTSGESVLISEGGASCGYINYVNEDFWCGCHCYRLHDIKVFPKYLFHALKANQQRIMALRTGSAMPNIQKSTIQKFELKIHDDLKIQQNISSMLDKCNVLIEKHKLILDKYDTLIKSRFIEMFGDPVNNTMKWETKTLSDWCTKVTDGTHDTPPRYTSGVLLLTGKNIRADHIDFTEIEYVSPEDHKIIYERCNPEYGDVLYTNIGVNYGTAVLNTLDYQFSMKNIALLKPKHDLVSGYYLWFVLNLLRNKILDENKTGGAQTFMSLATIRNLIIPMPPISLQNDFADFVQQIDKSKFVVQKSLEKAETLYKTLMQEYFG